MGMVVLQADPGDERGSDWRSGVLVLPRSETPLSQRQYRTIVDVCGALQTVPVSAGDRGETHALEVARLKVDIPDVEHRHPASPQIEAILLAPPMLAFYRGRLGVELSTLQRLQLNVIRPGGFIALHRDSDTDPRREVAMVLHLDGSYRGGQTVFTLVDGSELTCSLDAESILFSRGELQHRVAPVTAGVRRTLVAFLHAETGRS